MWLQEIVKPQIDWTVIESTFRHVPTMQSCEQDPVHHAEGDVWKHTRMVADALGRFDSAQNTVMRLTALFHDVEKPSTRVVEWDADAGRDVVRHPKHARLGAQTAWVDLWNAGVPVDQRLAVYGLILWHQRVFHLWDYSDMIREVVRFSAIGDFNKLIQFARADNAGRICADPMVAEDNLLLLKEWADERMPVVLRVMEDPASRIAYLEKDGRSPTYTEQPPRGSKVIVLSALPGAGKDHYCSTVLGDVEMISLDDMRRQAGIKHGDNQGTIIQAAYERAREFLRDARPFVWNATGLSRLQRGRIIGLARNYDAHVSIHALDRSLDVILKQNRERAHAIPEKAILDLVHKWEPPTVLEAHTVQWV